MVEYEWMTIRENTQHSWANGFITKDRLVIPYKKGKDHWNYGRVTPESTREKMRNAKRKKREVPLSGYYITRNGRFRTLKEAAIAEGRSESVMCERFKSLDKCRLLGYKFEYLDGSINDFSSVGIDELRPKTITTAKETQK